ncbi:uncharacterized protein BX664DRAFT_388642 [Halteromyces radiatus]|uniref:uncharacterized protein n=1 Tax=Halteromyces radiatus TaxID=101107 RepID=UPI00221FF0B0|nr:uncharacterized protein BX664DRAFT_388642 [Halteromyces radiatus]KAI8081697.1 hypothetical protein BX664DRAFT_388642 [Halteromyces radiatus]
MGGLENQLFQLKFTSKQLQKQSKKCQKDETLEKTKLKKALQDGHPEAARIYAENCIRKKNEALSLLRLSSRVDGVASKVQTAITMKSVSSSMANVVKSMEKSMGNMDLEKMAIVLDKFENQVETLETQERMTEASMPMESQVDQLMEQMMESDTLDLHAQLDQLQVLTSNIYTNTTTTKKDSSDDMLEKRLQALRS